ncbi:chemotaxis protein [Reinekea sp.]|uniref:chemotaxis protein n=1 Tax=Reinekea sp. TaxID=1970455 RepID=UPI002A83688D|nr:chemotaxis protein [Reinekea sp.]
MPSKATHSQGLLLFRLHNGRQFALGTLKIRELVPYQHITPMLNSQPGVLGAVTIRQQTIPVIDMAQTIGSGPVPQDQLAKSFIIVTDCQRKIVGFLISGIDKIIETNWKQIKAPAKALGSNVFITGTVEVDDKLVQLMDVELLIDRSYPNLSTNVQVSVTDLEREHLKQLNILVVDDSRTARKQLTDVLSYLNVPFEVTDNGHLALEIMHKRAAAGSPIDLLVSDIEMPGLDGYELTFEVRSAPDIAHAYIILHTSLSSAISVSQAMQVGANEALTKFVAKELVASMLNGAATLSRV